MLHSRSYSIDNRICNSNSQFGMSNLESLAKYYNSNPSTSIRIWIVLNLTHILGRAYWRNFFDKAQIRKYVQNAWFWEGLGRFGDFLEWFGNAESQSVKARLNLVFKITPEYSFPFCKLGWYLVGAKLKLNFALHLFRLKFAGLKSGKHGLCIFQAQTHS